MNSDIIKKISLDLNIREKQVEATLKMLSEGNTIPFIARYRKELTSGLDEEQIRTISEVYNYEESLKKRKDDVIRLITEKDLMTDELKKDILASTKLVEVEDLYRPFKEKKKTKATVAIALGLEPLAKEILEFKDTDIKTLVRPFLKDNITFEDAINGASYIISEYISDNAFYRKWLRNAIYLNGKIVSKKKKDAIDELKTYEMYYQYEEYIKQIKEHRILALNRGEAENILSVDINIDTLFVLNYLENKIIKNNNNYEIVKNAIIDSYKRLIFPSIEREIRSELTEKASISAINNFSNNLENLLLTPPIKEKMVLGLDPAYRTGCKLAVIDKTGNKICIEKIYPHEPVNKYKEAIEITLNIIEKYKIDIIAIGNGTASRESEAFIAEVIKASTRKPKYVIVSEAGASVYSASKLAITEFPDLHVEERSAISIARRLLDPLSELVKIDPESIGVGMYQHDVPSKELRDSLDFTVSKVVNQVGVNINTASASILKYVSGLTKKHIDKIMEYKEKKGKFNSRIEIEKLLTEKVYEQSIGFIRIPEGNNILDKTSIHPESYNATLKLLELLNIKVDEIGTSRINELDNIDIKEISSKLNIDSYTLEDIIKALKAPNRDPRDDMPRPILKSDILHIEDLKVGMELQGTVRNVIDFGAFVDIGLKNDGLIHISKMSNKYLKHPSDILSVGDVITCYVSEIFSDKNKVALSLIKTNV